MKDTMQALVKKERAPGLWLEEVPVPEVGINDVLIKIHKTAICGTDVHIWNWDAWSQKTIPVPMVVGHEFVGTVAAMGSNVHDLSIGEVVVDPIEVPLAADAPPGTYRVQVGLYLPPDGPRLPLRGGGGGDALELTQVEVK